MPRRPPGPPARSQPEGASPAANAVTSASNYPPLSDLDAPAALADTCQLRRIGCRNPPRPRHHLCFEITQKDWIWFHDSSPPNSSGEHMTGHSYPAASTAAEIRAFISALLIWRKFHVNRKSIPCITATALCSSSSTPLRGNKPPSSGRRASSSARAAMRSGLIGIGIPLDRGPSYGQTFSGTPQLAYVANSQQRHHPRTTRALSRTSNGLPIWSPQPPFARQAGFGLFF